MTATFPSDTQVLVVGAGPTGLTLAAQLLARGIPTRIIDKGAGPVTQSRALGIHARTLEMLDGMGLAEPFVEQGHPVHHLRMYAGNRNLVDLNLRRNGSRYGFALHLPQRSTEQLLRARVLELGGVIEERTELVGLAQDGDVVTARLRDARGAETEIRAGYVVGCDGAHSKVRRELGLAFEGAPYAQDWLLADVALEGAGSDDAVHLFFRPDGLPVTCIPFGGGRWRVVMPNAGDRQGQPPTLEEMQELVAQRAPRPIAISSPEWLASFRCHLRSTSAYRRGRVLVAGDAAHIHSPAGGQGMNTGMMDAANLAWKLALVAQGRCPDQLLDSYGQERIPVAMGVLGFTDKLVNLLTMRNPVKQVVRNAVLPAATSLVPVQRRTARRLSQMSFGYAAGPLVLTDQQRSGPKPGERCPDFEVRTSAGPSRLYGVLRAGRHVLVASDVELPTELASFVDLVDVVEGRELPRGSFALVRPDGVLATRGFRADVGRIVEYLNQLCGTDTTTSGVRPQTAQLARR
jgi:2-polyprenyl-6-methoxyphenol hydroxylase-like FAD-dependent oxidoreductase